MITIGQISRQGLRARVGAGWTATGRHTLPSGRASMRATRSFHSSDACRWGDVPEWASKDAQIALQGFKERFASIGDQSNPVSDFSQLIDRNQIHLLRITQASMIPLRSANDTALSDENQLQKREEEILTEGKSVETGIQDGSLVVPTEHLAFFTPRVASSTLGLDGSDTSFNPPGGVFTRRMWAGGEMSWVSAADDLRVNDEVWERTFVEDAQLKRIGQTGAEMILVWVRKEIGTSGSDQASIIDRRSWIFQRALDGQNAAEKKPKAQSEEAASSLTPPTNLLLPSLQRQSHANLFRYSAMTFNAHAIHLSPSWAQAVEGHDDVVVHGPLNLSLLVRKWGREVAGWHLDERGSFVPHSSSSGTENKQRRRLINVSYRAKRPVYAARPYWLGLLGEDGKETKKALPASQEQHHVVAMHPDGQVAMQATITSEVE